MSQPSISEEELERRLESLERLATFMDEMISIPGTNIRFGLDSIVGFIPGIGDLSGVLTHAYLLWQAHAMGIRKRVHARMFFNAFVDIVGGAPPIIGDIFDVIWKSNRMNVDLLRAELRRQREAADRSTATTPAGKLTGKLTVDGKTVDR